MASTISAGTTTGTAIVVAGDTTGNLAFQTNGTTTAMTINTSQNVGIGTTSPTFAAGGGLNVANGTFATMRARGGSSTGTDFAGGSDGKGYVYVRDNADLLFGTNNTEQMRILANGNVGIGTSSPAGRLHVNGQTYIQGSVSGGLANSTLIGNASGQAQFWGLGADTSTTGSMTFVVARSNLTSSNQAMTIDSSGNVLVGTTSNDSSNEGLRLRSFNVFQATRSSGECAQFNRLTDNGTVVDFRRSNSIVGSVSVTTTATTYNTSSDYRLKENIAPMTGALATVAALKPVTYKWKVDGSSGQGFIAHELQEIAPYAVSGEKDGEQMQGVDYGKITPLLTAALQEALAKIELLEARLAVLESK